MAKHLWDTEVGDCMKCGAMWDLQTKNTKCRGYFEVTVEKGVTKMSSTTGYWDQNQRKWIDGSPNGTQAGFTSSVSKCKGHNDTPVIDYQGMLITGYKKSDLPFVIDGKVLVMNLTGTSIGAGVDWPIKKLPELLKPLDKKEEYGFDMGEELLIDWPDQKGIAIRAAFWADALKAIKEAGYVNLNVCCFGGHGRTGTALACMAIACHAVKSGDAAVELVRKLHCAECIESYSQLDYIDYVCVHYNVPKTKVSTKS